MLKKLLNDLALSRSNQAEIESRWKLLNKRFKATQAYTRLSIARKSYKKEVAELEDEVRREGVAMFDGKNKQITKGVGIQESYTYDYDAQTALEWCKENLPIAIVETVDAHYLKTTIEALDKQNRLPDFVTKVKEVKATISRDLSFILEEDDGH